MKTEEVKPKYGVFIIESMDIDNELDNKLDGYTLKTILELCGIPNQYFHIRTKLELEHVIKKFDESEFGFLHIACHGNERELVLTFDHIDFDELDLIIGDQLYHRRLFLSACKVARFELAQNFIPKYHCYSVIGSPDIIDYDKAAVFWSSFYYLMHDVNQEGMPQKDIIPTLENITRTFNIKLNYYAIIKNSNPKSIDHLREIRFDSGKKIFDKPRKTEFRNVFR